MWSGYYDMCISIEYSDEVRVCITSTAGIAWVIPYLAETACVIWKLVCEADCS